MTAGARSRGHGGPPHEGLHREADDRCRIGGAFVMLRGDHRGRQPDGVHQHPRLRDRDRRDALRPLWRSARARCASRSSRSSR